MKQCSWNGSQISWLLTYALSFIAISPFGQLPSERTEDRVSVKLRSHMRGAVAERRRADFDIPAPLPRVCSHIRGADAGGSAISWGQWWFGTRGFEAGAVNWVLDPFLAERFLLSPDTLECWARPLGATARSYRRQNGADAAARFEKFLPARASLWLPISLKFATE